MLLIELYGKPQQLSFKDKLELAVLKKKQQQEKRKKQKRNE